MILLPVTYGQYDYYYSHNGLKRELDILTDRFVVKPLPSFTSLQIKELLQQRLPNLRTRELKNHLSPGFIEIMLDTRFEDISSLFHELQIIKNELPLECVMPVYAVDENPLIPTDIFIIKLADESIFPMLKQMNEQYGVEYVMQFELIPTMVVLRHTDWKNHSITEITRIYFENLDLLWSAPDFMQKIELNSTVIDPYYPYQFYLPMIKAADAWKITKGSSTIKVAVVDEGVVSHSDFPSSRIVNGHDTFNETGGAPRGNQAHGMACAGIIAATHNSIGIAGIAPNVKIMPIRIIDGYGSINTPYAIANAIQHAIINNADIISNSWASGHMEAVKTMIDYAMDEGRNGKGIIVIVASGNGGNIINTFPATVAGVITVGAVNQNDEVFLWSNYGPKLDLVAPSAGLSGIAGYGPCGEENNQFRIELTGNVWTLDIDGLAGWNPGNYNITQPWCYHEYNWDTPPQGNPGNGYTAHFGGTSAAAPQVSGVVALMLSLNPDLTLNEVRTILHNSADKVPGMGGQPRTNNYGYGRLNARKALVEVLGFDPIVLGNLEISGHSIVCSSNTTFTLEDCPSSTLATVTWSFNPDI